MLDGSGIATGGSVMNANAALGMHVNDATASLLRMR